jgi:hypothetical protein
LDTQVAKSVAGKNVGKPEAKHLFWDTVCSVHSWQLGKAQQYPFCATTSGAATSHTASKVNIQERMVSVCASKFWYGGDLLVEVSSDFGLWGTTKLA